MARRPTRRLGDGLRRAKLGYALRALAKEEITLSLDQTEGVVALDAYVTTIVDLSRAEIGRARGASDPERWHAAAEAWDRLMRPAFVAYARYRTAEAIIGRRGDRSVATSHLREAHDIATRLGAEPLRGEIGRLARHARITVDESRGVDEAVADPLGLTEREAEVIRLVAAGRSNQQIADELFITRKTASVHVSNILGKLGVANRVEAAVVAQRLGLGPDGQDE